jgi:hypothetical protein
VDDPEKDMIRSQVNFRVPESQLRWWKAAARRQGIDFSKWVKDVLNDAAGGPVPSELSEPVFAAPHQTHTSAEETYPTDLPQVGEKSHRRPDAPKQRHARRVHKRAKTCDHGRPRGHHCGLCGGKAKVK